VRLEPADWETVMIVTMRRTLIVLVAGVALAASWQPLCAQNAGQADLDTATDLQLTAETLGELERVIKFGESALSKGLDQGQQQFAKQLLAAALYQHANRSCAAIFERDQPAAQWRAIRQSALKNLERASRYDPTLPDVYFLEARLQAELPDGDRKAAATALDEAIKLLRAKDQLKQLSKAYVLRGKLQEEQDRKLADFELAVKADPTNTEAWQARAFVYLQKGDNEKAVADLLKLIEQDQDNPGLLAALADALIDLKKYDEAMKYCEEVIKRAPGSTLGFSLRARIKVMQDDVKGAIQDLNEALGINANDLQALLMRSQLHASQGDDAKAKADVERALKIDPDLPQGIRLRSILAAQQKKWGDAISDMQLLLQSDPTNAEFRLQLAGYYVGDNRPRRAIELLTSILDGLKDDGDDRQREIKSEALRARGDALLSVGQHAEAVKDYESALQVDPEDTGVLNNLAWVLATSTDDPVRNAERSIELGLKACELTKYERPHILSTLAAGYAEKGDWETALKWSGKAVELGVKDDMIDGQLKKELESYKEKKPWREKQEIPENTKPLGRSTNDLET
jgi:tetratricopeptide (TPR) repeat protein